MPIHNGPGLYLHEIDGDNNPHTSVDHLGSAPVHTLQLVPVLDGRDVPTALSALKGFLRSFMVSFTSDTNASVIAFDQGAITTLRSLSDLSVQIVTVQDDIPTWFLHNGLQ